MLCELAVTDLGVIGELSLVFGPGMTAVTGETGAGKTLVIEAIDLLVGGRADSTMVRSGARETIVEGRFVLDDDEVILRRVIPLSGRSRAYVNGRLATVAELTEWGSRLVDLHGQHAHQSLLARGVQRSALDRFGQIDIGPMVRARRELDDLVSKLESLGGDEQQRARGLDLLRFQMSELASAALDDPDEEIDLEYQEDLLADAIAHREAAQRALESLGIETGARAQLTAAIAALSDRSPFARTSGALSSLSAELEDLSTELRHIAETIEDDPARLDEIRERRTLLNDLRRKYGRSLADVIAFRDALGERIEALANVDDVVARLETEIARARDVVHEAERSVGQARRRAAPVLAASVEDNLTDLALAGSRLEITVGDDPGDDVEYLISTNPGSPPLPLAKVASGGELARAMLALRLVLAEAPDTLVFDEVDAGIGGEAAVTVGNALGRLGDDHQVLVVTHLPQVAAAADHHVVVAKNVVDASTLTTVSQVEGEERVVELARMLSGVPDSVAALDHARALLCRD